MLPALPMAPVFWIDTLGSAAMLGIALWIFYVAFKLRRRGYFYLYLFLFSCSLAAFAVSRALGHLLRNVLLLTGKPDIWGALSPISGSVNTTIFIVVASLSFYYGFFRDLQLERDRERERHLGELEGARDFLQKVIDSLNTQLVVIDRAYRVVMANKRFMEDTRLTAEQILGKRCHQVLEPFFSDGFRCVVPVSDAYPCPWKRIKRDGSPVVLARKFRSPEAAEPWDMEISASPVFGADGTPEYLIETLTNVTDKLKIEEMKRTQEKLGGIMEMASAVAHELNTPMFTVLGNAQLLKRALATEDEAQRDVDAIIRNAKKMSRLTKKMAHITTYLTKDYVDGEKLVDIMAASEGTEEGGEAEDERVEREDRWRRLEKMAAMGQLTAGVAHELNNALNIILGYSQLLLRETPESAPAHQDLGKIERNAKQCQRIVAGLLDYTRTMTREKAHLDVNRHLEEALRLVEHRMSLDGIRIVRNFAADLKPVLMDADEMRQVYLNLLNNAAQAIGRKGEVIVTTEQDPETGVVVVTIADTGPGIPEELIRNIFSPFFTTKEGFGTGLGLNVSRDIVGSHGGTLEAANRPEGGAVFRISLPASARSGEVERNGEKI